MSKALYAEAEKQLNNRTGWEDKQRTIYTMRHEGLRRVNKPFPTAADVHFPLVDMMVRRLKPFWFGQVFNSELLAQFVSLSNDTRSLALECAEWFDYTLNQETQFEDKFHVLNDTMNLTGRGILKVTLDPAKGNKLVFKHIQPIHILMSERADDFADADWFVEIQHWSVAAYKRAGKWKADEDTIKEIRGGQTAMDRMVDQDRKAREGLNCSNDEDTIVLFEHWRKGADGLWRFKTYSPQKPELVLLNAGGKSDGTIRCPFQWRGEDSLPFHSFPLEIKDEGWYSPRGLAELLAPIESILCKLVNDKLDNLTYRGKPMFTSPAGQAPLNAANIRFGIGEYTPGGLQAVDLGQVPIAFEQEINFWRSVAELITAMPDFGVGNREGSVKGRTATEISFIQSLSSVNVEQNGRMLRRRMAKLYTHCFALMVQFRPKELQFLARNELKQLPETALRDVWMIQPDGSADQWNKPQKLQQSLARFQAFNGHPNVDQEGLVRDVLATDDARLAQKLFIPTGGAEARQEEDEAKKILLCKEGWEVKALPSEDQLTRIKVLVAWIEKQAQTMAPMDPNAFARVNSLLQQRVELLKQLDPKAGKQVEAELMEKMAGPAAGGGVVPMPGAGMPPGMSPEMGGVSGGQAPIAGAAAMA